VALGGARQATWALSGALDPPSWTAFADAELDPADTHRGVEVRATYRSLRDSMHGQLD